MMIPLHGTRVIDLSQNLAGPYATMILADLGADVLKVEPPAGDPARTWGPPFAAGTGPLYLAANRNKQCITLDLKQPAERARLDELIADADVIVHAFRAGVAERLHLNAPALRRQYPQLICAQLSAYGSTGPLAHLPGFDPLMQAHAGIMSITGQPDAPARVGTSIVDMGAGMWLALGIMAALMTRARTGEGCVVQTSLYETALAWNAYHLIGAAASGASPQAAGTGFPAICPYEAFPTADGRIMIACANDRLFVKLCTALGDDSAADDPRFRTNPDRVAHRAVLVPRIAARTSEMRMEEVRVLLEAVGVPCAPLLDMQQVLAEPQTHAVGMLRDAGGYQDVALPLQWDGARAPLTRAAPI